MKDSATKGIENAKQTGQMRKDAAVHARKSSIGRRDNNSSGLSSSNSSIGSFSSSVTGTNGYKNSLTNSITSNKNIEAKNRLKRNQNLDKAISVAEKIPVANKYAKVARLAKKVTDAKNKKGGMLGKLFGNNDSKPTMSEIEDANASEVKGEEYNPEDSDGKYTVKLLDKRTKMIFLAIILGFAGACVFLCIFLASAVTGGGKESYLASHDNPSESDIEKAYNKDEEEDSEPDSDSDSSSSSSSSSSSRSSSSGSTPIKKDSTSNKILVGDSRGVHICMYIGGGTFSDCKILGIEKNSVTYFAGDGQSYSWFHSTALPEVKKELNSNKKSTVFMYMGTNRLDDLINQANSYAKDYNQLAKDYPDANIVAVSVTPIIEESLDRAYDKNVDTDNNVQKFNSQLKSQISSDVVYCDVYSKVKGQVKASDGIHYDSDSYKKIYNSMLDCIK